MPKMDTFIYNVMQLLPLFLFIKVLYSEDALWLLWFIQLFTSKLFVYLCSSMIVCRLFISVLVLNKIDFPDCDEAPGLIAHILTFVSLLLICVTFPFSLCWVVKVQDHQTNKHYCMLNFIKSVAFLGTLFDSR